MQYVRLGRSASRSAGSRWVHELRRTGRRVGPVDPQRGRGRARLPPGRRTRHHLLAARRREGRQGPLHRGVFDVGVAVRHDAAHGQDERMGLLHFDAEPWVLRRRRPHRRPDQTPPPHRDGRGPRPAAHRRGGRGAGGAVHPAPAVGFSSWIPRRTRVGRVARPLVRPRAAGQVPSRWSGPESGPWSRPGSAGGVTDASSGV
jgi:hypothetical protein